MVPLFGAILKKKIVHFFAAKWFQLLMLFLFNFCICCFFLFFFTPPLVYEVQKIFVVVIKRIMRKCGIHLHKSVRVFHDACQLTNSTHMCIYVFTTTYTYSWMP